MREAGGHVVHVEATYERQPRQEGRPVTGPRITVQVIGLEPQHVRVVERRSNGDERTVFIELAATTARSPSRAGCTASSS